MLSEIHLQSLNSSNPVRCDVSPCCGPRHHISNQIRQGELT